MLPLHLAGSSACAGSSARAGQWRIPGQEPAVAQALSTSYEAAAAVPGLQHLTRAQVGDPAQSNAQL